MKQWLMPALLALCPASTLHAAPPDPAAGLRVIDAARDRMNDAHGVGMLLMWNMDVRGVAIEIHQVLNDVSRLEMRPGLGWTQPVIVFNALIAGSPTRYAAARLARHAAEVKLLSWPDSAEKDYFLRSFTVRAWLEIGGDPAKLPSFDSVRDEKLAASLAGWQAGGLEGFVKESASRGRPTLASLTTERRKRFDSAVCEYEERGLLKEIADLESFQAEAAGYAKDEVGPRPAKGAAPDRPNTASSPRP